MIRIDLLDLIMLGIMVTIILTYVSIYVYATLKDKFFKK